MSYSHFTKNDYAHSLWMKVQGFQAIALALPKGHTVTKMMGTLAWGRNHFETSPDALKDHYVRAVGAMDGYFDCLNRWARDHDTIAQKTMLDLYPRGIIAQVRR